MFSRLMFSTIFMLPIFASTAILDSPDSTWLTDDDDALISYTDSTLNLAAPSSFNQPLSPSASDALLFGSAPLPAIALSSSTINNEMDIPDALLWNLDSSSNLPSSGGADENNESNLFLDDSFQLADCSTSSEKSSSSIDNILGKFRLRRRDDSNKCTNSDGTSHGSYSSFPADDERNIVEEMFTDYEPSYTVTQAMDTLNHNSMCYILTNGRLPWGVCSSGREEDQVPFGGQINIDGSEYILLSLSHATNGTFPPAPDLSLYICVS